MSTQFDTTISPARRQRLIWTLLGSCALAALQPCAALAQDGGAIVLDTVTVEADGAGSLLGGGYYSGIVVDQATGASRMPTSLLDTPASVSVITAEELTRRNADSVEEAVDYTAGVTTGFYGSDDRFDFIRIRGLDA